MTDEEKLLQETAGESERSTHNVDTPKRLTKKQRYRINKKELKEKKEYERYKYERIEREKTLDKYMAEFDPIALRKAEEDHNWAYILQKNLDSMKRDDEELKERLANGKVRPLTDNELKIYQWMRNYDKPLEVVYNQNTASQLLRFYK